MLWNDRELLLFVGVFIVHIINVFGQILSRRRPRPALNIFACALVHGLHSADESRLQSRFRVPGEMGDEVGSVFAFPPLIALSVAFLLLLGIQRSGRHQAQFTSQVLQIGVRVVMRLQTVNIALSVRVLGVAEMAQQSGLTQLGPRDAAMAIGHRLHDQSTSCSRRS